MELYKRYRPKKFTEIIGQPTAIKQLQKWIKDGTTPHATLFTGPSGCGKTTAARIMAKRLKCVSDLREINAASSRGIDEIRTIESKMRAYALDNGSKVYIVDEAHKLTGDAQNGFLKPLEDNPSHVYFILCSTHPNKLIHTIRTRCTQVEFKSIKQQDLLDLIVSVSSLEGKGVSDDVAESIAETAEGSARKALVLLEQVLSLEDEKDQLQIIKDSASESEAFEIWKALNAFKKNWARVAKVLDEIKDREDNPEGIRQLVLACCATAMRKNQKNAARAYLIYNAFRDDFYTTGHAGLAGACWEVIFSK